MLSNTTFKVTTPGRGAIDVTGKVAQVLNESGLVDGLCQIFICHTSASLMLCENADPSVRRDLEWFMSTLVPDGDPGFEHDAEGPDDMPAHIRSVLTHSTLSIPVQGGRLALGTWQGIFLWEHRKRAHRRKLIVTLLG